MYILRVAVGSSQAAQTLPQTSKLRIRSVLLTDTGESVQNFVAKYGVAECKKLNTVCEELRLPTITPSAEELSQVTPYQKPNLYEIRFYFSRVL